MRIVSDTRRALVAASGVAGARAGRAASAGRRVRAAGALGELDARASAGARARGCTSRRRSSGRARSRAGESTRVAASSATRSCVSETSRASPDDAEKTGGARALLRVLRVRDDLVEPRLGVVSEECDAGRTVKPTDRRGARAGALGRRGATSTSSSVPRACRRDGTARACSRARARRSGAIAVGDVATRRRRAARRDVPCEQSEHEREHQTDERRDPDEQPRDQLAATHAVIPRGRLGARERDPARSARGRASDEEREGAEDQEDGVRRPWTGRHGGIRIAVDAW